MLTALRTVFNPAGSVVRTYSHPKASHGCDWNPFNKSVVCYLLLTPPPLLRSIFATACSDNLVRIFDLTDPSSSCSKSLQGTPPPSSSLPPPPQSRPYRSRFQREMVPPPRKRPRKRLRRPHGADLARLFGRVPRAGWPHELGEGSMLPHRSPLPPPLGLVGLDDQAVGYSVREEGGCCCAAVSGCA